MSGSTFYTSKKTESIIQELMETKCCRRIRICRSEIIRFGIYKLGEYLENQEELDREINGFIDAELDTKSKNGTIS